MNDPVPAPAYAELHCLSAFSFQRGASTAKELFERAKRCGYRALAITDECSMAGIVRAYEAAREFDLPLIVGSELQIEDGPKLVLLAADLDGYVALCKLITTARRRTAKGEYRSLRTDFVELPLGLLALWAPTDRPSEADAAWLIGLFPQRLWIAVELHRSADDAERLSLLRAIGERHDLPLVATGDVHMHVRRRRALQDTLTAIRHHTTVADAGWRLFPNGERHLRTREALSAIYPVDLLTETLRVAERCRFTLDQLRYTYPHELVPEGHADLVAANADGGRHPLALARRSFSTGTGFDRARVGVDRRVAIRILFPDRPRHRSLRTQSRHPLPRAGFGCQLGGVLCAGRDRTRSCTHELALRAVHLARAQRAAGHRHRFRA